MKFLEVKEDPRLMRRTNHRYCSRHDIVTFLQEFLVSGIKFAKVELKPGEYADNTSARSAMYRAAVQYKMPIEVMARDAVIYLIRTDL